MKHPEPKRDLVAELEAASTRAQEYLNGWKRAQADYQNLQKEVESDRQQFVTFANRALLVDLLPVFSHFKIAMQHVPDEDKKKDWVVGVAHIEKQLRDFLTAQGVTEIATVGQPFDPALHEAVVHEAHDGTADNIIFAEVSPGYTLRETTLIPARVKVAKDIINKGKEEKDEQAHK